MLDLNALFVPRIDSIAPYHREQSMSALLYNFRCRLVPLSQGRRQLRCQDI